MKITYGEFDPITVFRRLRSDYPNRTLVVVIDRTLLSDRTLGPLLDRVVSFCDLSRVIQLNPDELGLLSSAETVNLAMKRLDGSVCVVIGGGSSIDAAKVGVAAVANPWLLDPVVWQTSAGPLPVVDRSSAFHALVSIPTCPGSGSHVSNLAALSPGSSSARRLVFGGAIKSDSVYIDSALWAGMSLKFKIDSLWEVLFRILGPYVVASNVSFRQSRFTMRLALKAVELGWNILRSESNAMQCDAIEIDKLSVDSSISWRTSGWTPKMNPWWCIQNSLAPCLMLSKREIVPLGLIQSLQIEPKNALSPRTTAVERLNLGRHLNRYSTRRFSCLLSAIAELHREYCRLFFIAPLGVDREVAERASHDALSSWPSIFRQTSLRSTGDVVEFIESI